MSNTARHNRKRGNAANAAPSAPGRVEQRAQGGHRAGGHLPPLPAGASYRPIPTPPQPYPPQPYGPGTPATAYSGGQFGVSYQGNYPGQNLQGDNSTPVQAYGPQYALVPISALPGLVGAPADQQQNGSSGSSSTSGKGATSASNSSSSNTDNLPVLPRPLGPRQAPMFPPGDPIRPIPNLLPRQYPYAVGTNIQTAPRVSELVDFPTLRNLSRLYEGITLCMNAIFRILRRTQLEVLPRPEYLGPDEDPTDDKWLTPALQMKEWFLEGPEKRGQDLTSWMVKAMTDLLEIDALGIYPVPTRGGSLFALELIAGDTIVPKIDDSGRIPYPPRPAYQQIVYGAPGPLFMQASGALNGLELDYLLMNPQTDSPYGVSPVQDVLLKINTALRKGEYDLQRYTSGSTPEGVIETQQPQLFTMTPDKVLEWQDMWNGVLAGNSAMRVKTPFVPPGFHFQPTRPQDVQTDFDRYCLNVTVARMGLTLDEIGFTETSNRATGSAQEAVVYRNAVLPYTNFLARYFTRNVICRYDGLPLSSTNATISRPGSPTKSAKGVWDRRYCVGWQGVEEPDDFNRRVSAHVQLVKAGIEGPTKALRQLGIKPDPGEGIIPAFIAVQGGPQSIAFIDDLVAQRDKMNEANGAALDAKIAASKQTQQAFESGQGLPGQAGQPGAGDAGSPNPPNPVAMQAQAAGKPEAAAQAANGGAPQQQQAKPNQSSAPKQAEQNVAAKVQAAAARPAREAAKAQRYDTVYSDDLDDNDDDNDDVGDQYGDEDSIRSVPRGAVHGDAQRRTGAAGRWELPADRRDALGSFDAVGGDNLSGAGAGTGQSRLSLRRLGRGAPHDNERGVSVIGDEGSSRELRATNGRGGRERDRERTREWGRYYERALKAVKQGRQVAPFTSDVLPERLHSWVATQLQRAATPDDVRAIFAEAKSREAEQEASDAQPMLADADARKEQQPQNAHDDPLQRLADALVQRLEAREASANAQITEALREQRTLVLQAIGGQ